MLHLHTSTRNSKPYRRSQPEAEIQRAVCTHLRCRRKPGVIYFAVPNGGKRWQTEAAILVGLGVRPGVSDLLLFHANKFYALELKAPGKKASPAQEQFLTEVMEQGGYGAVCVGLDQAIDQLEAWRLLRGVAS
jgi:VRR-NUC domain